MMRNCDVCAARYGVGDPRNWHNPENWPQECMDHYRKRNQKHGESPQYMKDIEPYKSTLDGTIINSRSAHKAHLRINGCIEVGNEKIEKKYEPAPGLTQDIVRAMNETGYWRP